MNQKNKDILGIVFFLIILIILIVVIIQIKSDGYKCMTSPLIYGAKWIGDSNKAVAICSCNFIADKELPKLCFNSMNMSLCDYKSLTVNQNNNITISNFTVVN